MFDTRAHLSDREILLTADGELSPRRLARARRHLAGCPACRDRLGRVERTLTAATEVCRPDVSTPLPPMPAARAQFRMRLTELSQQPGPSSGSWVGRWVVACAALLAAGAGALWPLDDRTAALTSRMLDRESGVFVLPRADLTPGTTHPVSAADICGAGRYGRTQPIPVHVGRSVFESYGADYRRSAEYELDHLITPELGGTSAARNLWPQAYSGTVWNAYVKDELELHFHRLACEGTIDIATAQHEMATDWIAAYKRYFNTERPLRDYASSPITERDGDLLRSELEELGISTNADRSDGPTLMAMLRAAR